MRRILLRFLGIVFVALATFQWLSGRVFPAVALVAVGLVLFSSATSTRRAVPTPAEPIDLDDAQLAEVLELLDQRRKIEAIKRVREMTGSSLKAAKDYVDIIEGELSMGVISGIVNTSLVMAVGLFIIARLKLGLTFETRWALLLVALVFGLANALIGPLMVAAGVPVNLLTLALAAVAVNALLIWVSPRLVDRFRVRGGPAIVLSNAVLLVAMTQLIFMVLALLGLRVGA